MAKNHLRITRRIAIWFHQSFGSDPNFSPGPFIEPFDFAAQREGVLHRNRSLRDAVDDAEKVVREANERALREKHRRAEVEELLEQLREERNDYRSLAEEYEERLAALQAQNETAEKKERANGRPGCTRWPTRSRSTSRRPGQLSTS